MAPNFSWILPKSYSPNLIYVPILIALGKRNTISSQEDNSTKSSVKPNLQLMSSFPNPKTVLLQNQVSQSGMDLSSIVIA